MGIVNFFFFIKVFILPGVIHLIRVRQGLPMPDTYPIQNATRGSWGGGGGGGGFIFACILNECPLTKIYRKLK